MNLRMWYTLLSHRYGEIKVKKVDVRRLKNTCVELLSCVRDVAASDTPLGLIPKTFETILRMV